MTASVKVTFACVESFDPASTPNDYLFQDDAYRAEDQARLNSWRAGDWHFIGIAAEATLHIVTSYGSISYKLKSPGLWYVESDSSREYLAEVFANECKVLSDDIRTLMTGPIEGLIQCPAASSKRD